ncbi:MAG: 50S ribosomal protein L21 [Clostridiales bacterium]|uniref:Large ribosomal subunit protein bL21 n=1 Tax=Harryflintia acetispora TaxID=1849041 RepID=A0A9X8UJL4_9FIRM|nr:MULTISPECIES: 50S ribosomal protein L21 [Oscillospiraceae]PWM35096.1 MAG: 50S ribosomal protein L21 [Clostridiales bacterium]RGB66495.1 50S ribosomal protein L21 [Harryflintia acetispora]TCL43552.1 large subunit ribosomal protein L21 [Harryflintia acetispora]
MYAVVEVGGKQYRVSEGDIIYVEKMNAEENSNVEITSVIAVGDEKGLNVGAPYVEKAKVTAKVLKNGKQKKVTVFTYRSKKDSKRKMGHRQPYTKIQIEKISA